MRVLVTYDIATADAEGRKRLTRVAKMMEGFGMRVQNSVFECDIDNAQFEKLRMKAETVLDSTKDSVIFYRMGACCSGKTLRLGVSPEPFTVASFVI